MRKTKDVEFYFEIINRMLHNIQRVVLTSNYETRSGGGRVVKLLACGARGPGFDSPPRHLNFRDWLSPASKSRYG